MEGQPSWQALMTGQFPHLYNTEESGGFTPIAMDTDLKFAIREGGRTVGAGVVTKIIE